MNDLEVEGFFHELSAAFQQSDVHKKAEVLLKLKVCLSSTQATEFKEQFSTIIPKVVETFDSILLCIESLDTLEEPDVTQAYKSEIQLACKMLDVLVSCVQASCNTSISSAKASLPKILLRALNSCYRHCEDSSEIYGSEFPHLTDLLGVFFKLIVRLQSVSINFIDSVVADGKDFADTDALHDVCLEFQSLCTLLAHHELTLAHAVWKTFVQFICRFHASLIECLDVQSILLELCKFCHLTELDMGESLLLQSVEPNELNEKSKLIAFNINFVVMIRETFERLEFPDELLNVILEIYNLVLKQSTEVVLSEDPLQFLPIGNNLFSSVSPLIQMLIREQSLVSLLMNFSEEDQDGHQIPACLLIAKILAQSSSISNNCDHDSDASQYLDTFEKLLLALVQCDLELDSIAVPGTLIDNDMQRSVSMHEYMVLHLGVFAAKSCACHISDLEEILIKSLFLEKDSVKLLVCDIWCFLARYGPANLCYSHCCTLVRLRQLVHNSYSQMWISFLLRRLVGQMNEEQKLQLKHKHLDLEPELFSKKKKFASNHSLDIFSTFDAESSLSNVSSNVNFKRLDIISALLEKYISDDKVTSILRVKLAMAMLEMLTNVEPASKCTNKPKEFLLNFCLWKSKSSCIQLHTLVGLCGLLKVGFDNQIEAQVLEIVTSVFEEILTSGNAVYHYEMLYVISELACHPKHKSLVKGFADNPNLKAEIKRYIKKVSSNDDTPWSDIISVVKSQREWMENHPSSMVSEQNDLSSILNSTPLPSSMPERNSEIEQYMQDLTNVVEKLIKFQPLPLWAHSKVDHLLRSIQTQ